MEKIKNIKVNLGEDASFKGVMNFHKPLRIAGRYEGTIESDGFLFIEKGAEIKADINVKNVVVGGTVYGDIVAEESLLLQESGKVFGNIRTASLEVENGFEFRGKCEMLRDLMGVDIFSQSVTHLKKALTENLE